MVVVLLLSAIEGLKRAPEYNTTDSRRPSHASTYVRLLRQSPGRTAGVSPACLCRCSTVLTSSQSPKLNWCNRIAGETPAVRPGACCKDQSLGRRSERSIFVVAESALEYITAITLQLLSVSKRGEDVCSQSPYRSKNGKWKMANLQWQI